MKKWTKKSYVILVVSTLILVFTSTFLLRWGISFVGNSGLNEPSVLNVSGQSSLENNKIPDKGQKELTKQEILTQSQYGVTEQPPTVDDINHIIGRLNLRRMDDEKQRERMIKQEESYQSVKESINIKKEDVEIIFLKYNKALFNESLDTLGIEIFFSDFFAPERRFSWQLSLAKENNKKYYYCEIDAITGQLSSLTRADYSGLQEPEYSTLITKHTAGALMDNKLSLYESTVREIISSDPFNVKVLMIKDINLTETLYIGFRPKAVIRADLSDGKAYEISFYTDTDEIISLRCI